MLTLPIIEQSYNDLMTAKELLHKKTEAEISSKEGLATKKAELLMSGAIIGKNAETRYAQLAEGCKDEAKLRIAETEEARSCLAVRAGFHRCEHASRYVNTNGDRLTMIIVFREAPNRKLPSCASWKSLLQASEG
jgi:hypothetical protein